MTADPPNREVELGTHDGNEFANSPAAELAGPAEGPPDNSISQRIDEAHLTELQNKNKHRGEMVKWSLQTVGVLTTAATLLMVAYVVAEWGHIEASVMIAYFTSVVAESIGILYVIARYLFPSESPKKK